VQSFVTHQLLMERCDEMRVELQHAISAVSGLYITLYVYAVSGTYILDI
jgi:hypothetical protein